MQVSFSLEESRQGGFLRYLDTTARLVGSSPECSVVLICVGWLQCGLNKWMWSVLGKDRSDVFNCFWEICSISGVLYFAPTVKSRFIQWCSSVLLIDPMCLLILTLR